MLELKIPQAILDEPQAFSASVIELGPNAGQITWAAAQNEGVEIWDLTDDQVQELRDYFDSFGAWDDIQTLPVEEIKALLTQFVSGDLREYQDLKDEFHDHSKSRRTNEDGEDRTWADEWDSLRIEGTVSGNIFLNDDALWVQLSN